MERSRIARELHAGAGQPLAGIRLNLELLRELMPNAGPSAQQALERLESLSEQALEQVRSVSHRLHPPRWQELGIEEALRSLLDSSGLGARMELRLELNAPPRELAVAIKTALYRCAQECISNIARHSQATRVEVRLEPVPDGVQLTFRDNGIGLQDRTTHAGIGLRALQEHATALGGSVTVSSGIHGTSVTTHLPLGEE